MTEELDLDSKILCCYRIHKDISEKAELKGRLAELEDNLLQIKNVKNHCGNVGIEIDDLNKLIIYWEIKLNDLKLKVLGGLK